MKNLILNSENQIVGYSESQGTQADAQTNDKIPEYDQTTQSIYWENNQIIVKDDDQKIAEKQERIANQYKYDRQREYPSIKDLVVALYDESDKQALIEKRNLVKAKYPKP